MIPQWNAQELLNQHTQNVTNDTRNAVSSNALTAAVQTKSTTLLQILRRLSTRQSPRSRHGHFAEEALIVDDESKAVQHERPFWQSWKGNRRQTSLELQFGAVNVVPICDVRLTTAFQYSLYAHDFCDTEKVLALQLARALLESCLIEIGGCCTLST